MYDIILKKRKGKELSAEEIDFFVRGYTSGDIPDYQASALLMAICLVGMTGAETDHLTRAMAESGSMMELSSLGDLSADKHSTGGVGDKTSLIVAPVVAALGGKVAKMSGRGLGHTGGTVDKLEAIPGYRTDLSPEDFISQVERIGIAMIGQSGNLAPADKKLYALRDVTATVDSIPLITSSIMSKKLAAGSKNIVLDVKVGSGAFMKTVEEAEVLASEMVRIGKSFGRRVSALITDMDRPLGYAVGNSLEIIEAIGVLRGDTQGELAEISIALAAEMIALIYGISEDEARKRAKDALCSGAAFEKLLELVSAQGGDTRYIEDTSLFPRAAHTLDVRSGCTGYITKTDAESIGRTAVILGAGREAKEDDIDLSAGIVIRRSVGDRVLEGDILCTLHTNRADRLAEAEAEYLAALTVQSVPPEKHPLIRRIIR